MRFMMLMIPKDYANAKPDFLPDPKLVDQMGEYNGARPPAVLQQLDTSTHVW